MSSNSSASSRTPMFSSPPLLPSTTSPPSPSSPSPPSPPFHTSRRLSSPSSHGESKQSHAFPHKGGLNMTADIILATVGTALLLVLLIAACACCSRSRKKRKKQQQPHNAMLYYADSSQFQGNSTYYYTNGMQLASSLNWRVEPSPPSPPPDMNSTTYSTGLHGALPPMPPPPPVAPGINKSAFSYEELAAATGNFSQANLLGQGGFGYVHKGVLPGGKEVAVKQLKSGSGQGEREFQAEVDIISRVHHRHLVSLVGYCIAGAQRMLVYEFVPNRTLEYHLHGKGLPVMDWTTRLRIALGSAKGLAYLHEDCHPRIIHRDIKSANILLDNNFEAMVADFGLAKLTTDNHTHVSTRVMGTFGYLAPEYASSGKLTEKSDIFSYGVMLLELLMGQRPADSSPLFNGDCLVDWARPVLSRALIDGNYDDLVDPRLDGDYDHTEAARMVASAAACVRHSARKRPKMSQIVRALEGDVAMEDLNEGVRPGQSMVFGSSSSSEYGSGSYTTNMERIRKVALPSPEYSGEYGGPVSEFRLPSPVSSDGCDFSDELNPARSRRHRAHS